MSATTDRAQFYLEQQVPALRELQATGLFTPAEIRSIVSRRRDFEHRMNSQGARLEDALRYIDYEVGIEEMRRLRAQRLGGDAKRRKQHAGPRRLFPLLERMTRKFKGEIAMWLRYIEYARKQRAFKRVRKAMADMLRLHPTRHELWVYAARYEFEELGDLNEAEAHVQRGLRMMSDSRLLYLEFFRLLLDALERIEIKSGKLGVDKRRRGADGEGGEGGEELIRAGEETTGLAEDGDLLMLPSADEPGFGMDADGNEIDPRIVEALEKTRGPHEQIARAVFDSAMKQFKGSDDSEIAYQFFDMAADYQIPGREPLLTHILDVLRARDAESAFSRFANIRLPLVSLSINTADFANGLIVALGALSESLSGESVSARMLHVLSVRWMLRNVQAKGIDEDIRAALEAMIADTVASYQKFVERPNTVAWKQRLPRPQDEAVELIELGRKAGAESQARELQKAALARWPGRIPLLEEEQEAAEALVVAAESM